MHAVLTSHNCGNHKEHIILLFMVYSLLHGINEHTHKHIHMHAINTELLLHK